MRRWSALLIFPLLAGLAMTWPAWRDPSRLAPSTRFTDGHLLGATVWGEVLLRGELPSVRTTILWPGVSDFRPLLWPAALVEPVFGPALTVTLAFALTPAFNALSGWFLGAALLLGPRARVVLGAALAVHPWVVETLVNGQVEQAVLGGAALQLAVAVVALRAADARKVVGGAVLAGFVTLAVGIAAPHVALAGALLVGLWCLDLRAREGDLLRRRIAVRGAVLVAVGVACLIVHAYHSSAFLPGPRVYAPKGSDGRPTSLADLPEVTTLARLLFRARASEAPVVHPNWLGGTLPILALLGAWRWRSARVAVAAAAAFCVLSLGTSVGGVPLPWSALVTIAPTIGQSLSAYRMVAGAVVALAVAAAWAVEGRGGSPLSAAGGAQASQGRASEALLRWAWVPLAALLMVEGLVFSTRPLPMSAQAVVSDRAHVPMMDGPVLDLPLAGPECPGGVGHYLLEAARSGRSVPLNLANPRAGYAAVPGMVGEIIRASTSKECAARLGPPFERWPFTTIVLHEHAECPVPPRLEACLEALFGAGTREGEVRWWVP